MDGRGYIRGWAGGDGLNRTISGAIFADHTELVDSEGDWLIDLQWQIGSHRFKAHIDPEFGRQDPAVSGKFSHPGIDGRGHH